MFRLRLVHTRGGAGPRPGALVRQAAHRKQGRTVELDAGPDGGARFTVRLPLGDRTAKSEAAGARAKEVTA